MMKMITRDKAIEIMRYSHICEYLRYEFPVVNAFEIKNSTSHMLSWDSLMDYINGGVVERGKEMSFRCGPVGRVIQSDFEFALILNLNENTDENNRICIEISLKNHNTDWVKSKNYYWQEAVDVAVVYYVASHVIYEQAEDLLTHRRTKMKLTRGLENDIMQSMVIAGLE
jgi:hypothetical protein